MLLKRRISGFYPFVFFVGVCLSLGVACSNSRAEVGLPSIFEIAVRQDPQFQQVDAARLATLERRPQAIARLMLPEFDFSGNVSKNYQDITVDTGFGAVGEVDFTSHRYTLNLTQPIFHYDRYIQLKQADLQIRRANIELDAALQDLIVRVSQRYFAVLAAGDNVEFSRAEKIALGQQLEESNQRFEVGLIAITDVQEARAGYDLAVANEIQALNLLDNTREALRELTGIYYDAVKPLGKEVPLIAPTPEDIDAWTETALRQNRQLAAVQTDSEIAAAEIRNQFSGHLPSVDLVGIHDISETGGRFGATDTTTTAIGVEFNVPIFQGGQVISRTSEAGYRYRESLERLKQQLRETQRLARESYLGVISGISRVKALQQAVVSSETAVEATKAGYAVGTRTAVEVVVSERELLRARRDYAQSRYDYILDTLRLKQAAGTLDPDDIKKIGEWLL